MSKNADVKWVACVAVGDTEEQCRERMDAFFKGNAVIPEACVVERFYVGPVVQDMEHCTVVRTGAVMRAFMAAVEAK